jgi:hypothetical protein
MSWSFRRRQMQQRRSWHRLASSRVKLGLRVSSYDSLPNSGCSERVANLHKMHGTTACLLHTRPRTPPPSVLHIIKKFCMFTTLEAHQQIQQSAHQSCRVEHESTLACEFSCTCTRIRLVRAPVDDMCALTFPKT